MAVLAAILTILLLLAVSAAAALLTLATATDGLRARCESGRSEAASVRGHAVWALRRAR
jgi:hypothetical protein